MDILCGLCAYLNITTTPKDNYCCFRRCDEQICCTASWVICFPCVMLIKTDGCKHCVTCNQIFGRCEMCCPRNQLYG